MEVHILEADRLTMILQDVRDDPFYPEESGIPVIEISDDEYREYLEARERYEQIQAKYRPIWRKIGKE